MGRKNRRAPEMESRGGNRVDWNVVQAGEPLQELPPPEIAAEEDPQPVNSPDVCMPDNDAQRSTE